MKPTYEECNYWLRSEVERLHAQNDKLIETKEELNEIRHKLTRQISKMREENEEILLSSDEERFPFLYKNNQALIKEVEKLEKTINSQDKDIRMQQEAINELNQQNKERRSTIDHLTTWAYEERKTILKKLRDENEELKRELSTLTLQIKGLPVFEKVFHNKYEEQECKNEDRCPVSRDILRYISARYGGL